MKLVVVLAVLCCFTLGALASPLPSSSASDATEVKAEVTGRQAPAASPAASSDDDDDDDDDDDGIVDLGLDDDDDDDDDDDEDDDDEDDDDDEEDEEDGDYVERFIEDILGGDDDDDDDDDDDASPAAGAAVANPVQILSAQPVAQPAQPVIPLNVAADLNAAVAEAAVTDPEDGAQYGEDVPEEQAAASVVEATDEGAQTLAAAGNAQLAGASAPVAEAAVVENDEDDDDDEDDEDDDDVDLGIPGEDDDDDDDEDDATGDDATDDDDDDDDDDDGDGITDLVEARRKRGMSSTPNKHVPAIYIAKYNRFVDNILGRINKILRTNYNPVTVKLTNPEAKSNKKKTKGKGNGKGKRREGTRNSPKNGEAKSGITIDGLTRKNATAIESKLDLSPEIKLEGTKNSMDVEATTLSDSILSTTVKNVEARRAAATGNKKKTKRPSTKKNKTKSSRSRAKARATLYGLSSLQRVGDVSVNMMTDHTTVKTKFSLGPLTLRVEREIGRSGKKEIRSATATTAEMSGKLNLRVLHGGAATLHSIRVLQPKQVRIESPDDHDRTREFVWKKSSHIAHVVSEKLSSATKSMLRPPPIAIQVA